jgi:hypothetical protein
MSEPFGSDLGGCRHVVRIQPQYSTHYVGGYWGNCQRYVLNIRYTICISHTPSSASVIFGFKHSNFLFCKRPVYKIKIFGRVNNQYVLATPPPLQTCSL